MDNKILQEHNEHANHLVARVLRYGILLMALIAIASNYNIFTIDVNVMRSIVLLTCTIYMIPTLLFDLLKINRLWVELLVLALIVFTSGIMYVCLSYHVVMVFVIPVCIACLYTGKRYLIFTTIVSIPTIIMAHLIAFKLKIVPDEPLVTLHGVIYYGILPRIIQFLGCSLVCIGVAERTKKLILNLLNLHHRQLVHEEVLHQVITETEKFISARSYNELMAQATSALKGVLEVFLEQEIQDIAFINGHCIDYKRDLFWISSNREDKGLFFKEQLQEKVKWIHFNNLNEKDIYLEENRLTMQFHNKEHLLAFITLEIKLQSSIELINILRIVHTQIEKSIINMKINKEMIETQRKVIQSLAEVCESKSKQTGQHIKRVAEYMCVMGNEMGLDDVQCDRLAMAAMLHDIGKLKIPDEILEKPGKLTPEEFEQIKSHVHVGKQLLEKCHGEVMELGKIIAYQHHEKWDGTGYLKMKGEEIHPYARIVAIIDVFDALVSKRSYKKAWTPEAAYEEIVAHRGTHFAPEAVDLFIKTYPKLLMILELYPD